MKKWLLVITLLSFELKGQTISELVHSSDIVYPKTAVAIARLETGNFKSQLYKSYNNAFGFKDGRKYKRYTSKQQSVADYYKFETKIINKYSPKNRTEYLIILSKMYAADKKWLKKIQQIINT